MVGIVSYGAYVPLHRLGPGTRGWMGTTEKAVASWDEDSLTMAVEAALDCIGKSDRNQIDGAISPPPLLPTGRSWLPRLWRWRPTCVPTY